MSCVMFFFGVVSHTMRQGKTSLSDISSWCCQKGAGAGILEAGEAGKGDAHVITEAS